MAGLRFTREMCALRRRSGRWGGRARGLTTFANLWPGDLLCSPLTRMFAIAEEELYTLNEVLRNTVQGVDPILGTIETF